MSSEMVRVICPHCRRVYDLAADVAAKRKKAQCGRCRKTFEIAGRAQPIIARAADVAAKQDAQKATPPPIPPAAMATPPPIPNAALRRQRGSAPPPGFDFDKSETLPPAGPPKPRPPDTIRPGVLPATEPEMIEAIDADDIMATEAPETFEPSLTEGARRAPAAKTQSAADRASQNEIELAALERTTPSLGPAEVRPRPSWLAHAEAVLAAPPGTSAPPSA